MHNNDRSLNPDRWVTDHGDTLFAYAVSRIRNPDSARDLVQETFAGALQSRHGYAGRASERTWLLGILKHKLWDLMHRQRREQVAANPTERFEDLAFDEQGNWKNDWKPGPALWIQDPEQAMRQGDFRRIFDRCLAELPARQASAFRLREIQGLDTDTICALLDVKPNNLWVLLHRARLHLRARLESRWLADANTDEGRHRGWRPDRAAIPAAPSPAA